MGRLGFPELIFVMIGTLSALIPFVLSIWALVMLYGIRAEQTELRQKLDTIERLVQHS